MTLTAKIKKNKKRRSLSSILLFYFLSFFIIIFIILAAISGYVLFRNQEKIIFSQQQLVSSKAADIVRGFIIGKFVALETSAMLVNPALTSREEQERILNYLLGAHQDFRWLVLKNTKKQNIVDKSRLTYFKSRELLNEQIGNELYARIEQGKRYISEVYVDLKSSEPMVIIAVPVKDYFGNFQGILITEVNLKFMWNLMENLKIGNMGLAYIVDRQGKLIAFGDISRVLQGENAGNLKVVYEFMNNSESMSENKVYMFTGITGTHVIGSYVSLVEPDFAIITEQPVYEVYQTVIQMGILSLVFSIIMWVLVIWISIRLARRLSVPLTNLMKVAGRIAGGERGLHALVSGPIEIANMAEAFNNMTAQLKEVIDNLEDHNKYLEITVKKYVEYMAEVGKGNLDSLLTIEEKENKTDNPLVILGRQLNETTTHMKMRIEQIQDTTNKLKQNEKRLQIYSDRLEKSNKELEQFAYIASHDLQEPLRKLMFYGDRLKNNYSSILDEKAMGYLDRMNNAVARMENFIKDLLQYSRVTTQAKSFEKVDLNEIINDVLGDLEIRIKETGAEIKIENLPVIEAEPLQIRQLFQNIIGNAIKYRRENVPSVITINSRVIRKEDNDFCEINITDNGIGFDEKYRDQIFGLFQRFCGKNEYEGTGIGLAICKKIVKKHNGVISASGKKGEGSIFCILLPLEQKVSY